MPGQKALLVVNRHSRRGRESIGGVLDRLTESGFSVTRPPAEEGGLDRLLRRHAPGHDLVVLGGGDGTLNAGAEALLELGLPLGIIPLGTGNDLARTLGLPLEPLAAAEVVAKGHRRRIDLGWVNGKHFFNAATIGLSVAAAQRLTGAVKRRYGPLGYPMTLIDAWKATHPFKARISCGGRETERRSVQIVVGNGRHHGAGMTVASEATIDDHKLDLYSLDQQTWWQVIRHLPTLRTGGTGEDREGIWRARGPEAVVDTDHRHRISTDGEITTHTPATFRVVPEALEVFVPPPAAGD